jgi:hypothetical protein
MLLHHIGFIGIQTATKGDDFWPAHEASLAF